MYDKEDMKEKIERVFSGQGITPVYRTKVAGEEVFIADGFVSAPIPDYYKRFDITAEEYPHGCFVTLWFSPFLKGIGNYATFDPDHDPLIDVSYKQKARINAVKKRAEYEIIKNKTNMGLPH